MGLERRERVVGDLGTGGRDRRDERALARVRKPDQSDISQELELEVQPVLLSELCLLGESRCPAAVREELGVAFPPATTALNSFGAANL